MSKILNVIFLILGFTFLVYGGYLVWQRNVPLTLVQASDSANVVNPLLPTRLLIPTLNLDLSIFSAKIVGGVWETSNRGVSYLITSPVPGELGNSVIYGHNWDNLLGHLKQIKPGDSIIVVRGDGQELHFVVHFVSIVTPDETHIYNNTSDYRLTLYTCTGLLDSKRLVATAILD